ncbi:MAG TPA: X2-like carbohydrate binding domain-containing protein [Clostridia bacterium]
MANEISEKDTKQLIEYIKDVKNSQLNKLNATLIKTGTIIAFIATSLLFLVNKLPDYKPSNDKMLILIFLTSSIMSIPVITFNIINQFLRAEAVKVNMLKKYNALEKQFLIPIIIASQISNFIWLIINIISLGYALFWSSKYKMNPLPIVVYIVMSLTMILDARKAIKSNYKSSLGFFRGVVRDVSVDIIFNWSSLNSISSENYTLQKGKDYITYENSIILKSSYLDSLSVGNTVLELDFDSEKRVQIIISVKKLINVMINGVYGKLSLAPVKSDSSDKSTCIKENNGVSILKMIANFIIMFGPIACAYQIYQCYYSGLIFENRQLLIYSIYLVGIIISLYYIARYYSYKIIYSWIENFYNEIIEYGLTGEQIHKRFFEEYTYNDNLELFAFKKSKNKHHLPQSFLVTKW